MIIRLSTILAFALMFVIGKTQPPTTPPKKCPWKQTQYRCTTLSVNNESGIETTYSVTYHYECAVGGSDNTCDVIDCNGTVLLTLICTPN